MNTYNVQVLKGEEMAMMPINANTPVEAIENLVMARWGCKATCHYIAEGELANAVVELINGKRQSIKFYMVSFSPC